MIAVAPTSILIALDEDKIIATVFLIPYGSTVMHLYRLAVLKEYREQGIASMLLEHAQKIAKECGCVEVALFVNSANKPLLDFYKKRGFTASEDSYIPMWKELNL